MSDAAQRRLDERFEAGLEWARWAVGRWSGFPVDSDPRPLVLVAARVHVEGGFATGAAKMAYLAGLVDWRASAPAAVMAQLRNEGGARQRRTDPLVITDASRGEAEFVTDRGLRRLPAWRLSAVDARGPIWILAPDVTAWEPDDAAGGAPPESRSPLGDPRQQIDVAADDRSVTVHWFGAPPIYEHYDSAVAVESEHAVAFVARGRDIGPDGWRTAAGYIHRVPAQLREPLGNRVFVSLHGLAGEVRRPSEAAD